MFDIHQLRLINKYAIRDFSRSYKKLWVVASTLFISLLLLSLTFSVKEALNNEIEANSKELLGGDIQVTSGIDPLPSLPLCPFPQQATELWLSSAQVCCPRTGNGLTTYYGFVNARALLGRPG